MFRRVPQVLRLGTFFGATTTFCDQRQRTEPLQPANPSLKYVGKRADFAEGTIKEVKFPNRVGREPEIVAVAKVNNKIYIVGASCSHYSAPLGDGIIDGMSVVCPWHDAAFDLTTGQPIRGPVLDAIPTFEVVEKGEEIFCTYPDNTEDFIKPHMAKADAGDNRLFAIVGGGAAAAACVESLRAEGYTGGIVMVSNENHPPVDTPMLSKNVKKRAEDIQLRPNEYYDEELSVRMRLGEIVERIDPIEKTIKTNRETIKYDKCLVCTGAQPRRLPIPNADKAHVVRKCSDVEALDMATNDKQDVVIVGSSFIGIELCNSLLRKKCTVTVVSMEDVPFERVLGKEIGAALLKLAEKKGVTFIPRAKVASIKTEMQDKVAKVTGVELVGGTVLKAGVCVFACGVTPNTDVVDVKKTTDGGIVTSPQLETSAKDLYAAGDIAAFEVDGRSERIEHWDVAFWHGRLAGKTMTNQECAERCDDVVPFFWTSLFGKNLRYVGYGQGYDSVHIEGNLDTLNVVCYYFRGDAVAAVCTMARDPVAICVGKLLKEKRMPSKQEVTRPEFESSSLLNLAKERGA